MYHQRNTQTPNEPPRAKTNKMTFAPSEDSGRPGHPPCLIRILSVRMKKHWSSATHWAHCGCPGWSESSLGAQIILLVMFVMRRIELFTTDETQMRVSWLILQWLSFRAKELHDHLNFGGQAKAHWWKLYVKTVPNRRRAVKQESAAVDRDWLSN